MITKMLIKEPSPTYPPVTKIVYRPNERVKFSDIWIKKGNCGIIETLAVDKPRNSSRQDGCSAQSSPAAQPEPVEVAPIKGHRE